VRTYTPGAIGVQRQLLLLLTLLALQAANGYGRVELSPCKNHYSPEQQIELGQKASEQVYRQMPVLPDSSPVTQYVQQLGRKLAAQAPGYKWPFNFHVANVAEINAFALPGGSIFVNLGTIQAATDEAQLAGVMAHEISHVVLQHSVCNAEKEQRVGLLAGLGQLAAGVVLGNTAGEIAQQGIGMTAGLGFMKMSRGAEKQADLEGVGILYDADYDPHGMPQFFQTIESKYGKGGAQFLSDHPNPGNRTEYIDQEISSFVARPNTVVTTAAFTRIKSQVAGMHAFTARELSSGTWKTQNPNQTVAGGINEAAGENPASAAPDLNTADSWKTFSGAGFSVQIPGTWQGYGNRTSAMIGPRGGIARSAGGGAGNLIYGMLTDRYQPPPGVPRSGALDSLTAEIARDNSGAVPGPQQQVTINGIRGEEARSRPFPCASKCKAAFIAGSRRRV